MNKTKSKETPVDMYEWLYFNNIYCISHKESSNFVE